MLVLVCNRAEFEAFGFFGRHCHHSEVSVCHAGPISRAIYKKSIRAARVGVNPGRRVSFEVVSNKAHSLRSNRIERVILHALIADARTDRDLDLRYRLFTALYEKREIVFITLGVKDNRLPDLESVRVEHKRDLFLLACSKIYLDVTVSRIDTFDAVSRRTEHRIQRCVAGVQLQRHEARLTL